ncbi:MAG: JAB domain-containing protein [Cypionkella sp.]|nr:JAB domain-containing protein [Cypionkella sp.]
MTPHEETVILKAREILGRYLNQNPVLGNWQAVRDYCAVAVRGEVERFHVLYLDRRNRVISDEQLSIGTVDHVPVYPREIIKRALMLNASALIVVHYVARHIMDLLCPVFLCAPKSRSVALSMASEARLGT